MQRTTLAALTFTIILGATPAGVSAQLGARLVISEVRPTTGLETCMLTNRARGERVLAVLDTRLLEQDRAREALLDMQESVSIDAAARPEDVDAQYALAAILGSRAEVEGGRTRVKAAQAMHQQALRVLALDPDHAGAHYLMGRLHAGVMRLDRITRFVATRLLGGGALAGASWEEAQARLELAVVEDPCVPDHHYELARLYADRGQPDLAMARLEQLDGITPTAPFAGVFADADELLDRLRRQYAGAD